MSNSLCYIRVKKNIAKWIGADLSVKTIESFKEKNSDIHVNLPRSKSSLSRQRPTVLENQYIKQKCNNYSARI